MEGSKLIVVHLAFLLLKVEGQSFLANDESSQDSVSNFEPSLAVVIGVLFVLFTSTFIFVIYIKFCNRRPSVIHVGSRNRPGLVHSGSGIDKTVIESLPFFRFSSLKGSRGGLECVVCLSKFEDIEILRLLPNCKHAFHINCVDQWLENHSSCPLCRSKINPEDPTTSMYTNSMRLAGNRSGRTEDSSVQLFVEREEKQLGSSRFSLGNSFRKGKKSNTEERSLIEEAEGNGGYVTKNLNKHKHKIIVSDVVFKNRWSSVSSSDLVFLNTELLNDLSSNRFTSLDVNRVQNVNTRAIEDDQLMKIKEEIEMKRLFENKVNSFNTKTCISTIPGIPTSSNFSNTSKTINSNDRRSVSEITALSRFRNIGIKNMVQGSSSGTVSNTKEEQLRMMWLPIAKRTAQWFVNRERMSLHTEPETTRQTLNV